MQATIFKPGDLCGRYRVDRVLGSGGFGEVYRAKSLDAGSVVALKCLHVRHADNTHVHQRMVAEAELLSATRHDNLVRVFDYGMSDGVLYMVMEYLEGTTLRQVLRVVNEHGTLPLASALLVAREVADGVDAAHECGVVHRDLKPENIFVTSEGRVKVLDLGAGKFFGWGLASTGQGLLIGTPMYMAPEHIRGQSVDARTDVYALGVMLYEMCAGHFLQRHAEEGAKKNEIAVLQLHFDPPPLRELVSGCPPYVSDLVKRAMAKYPADRFASMSEFARAIRVVMRRFRAESGMKASAELAKDLSAAVLVQTAEESTPEALNELVAAVARLREKQEQKRERQQQPQEDEAGALPSENTKTAPYERLSQTPQPVHGSGRGEVVEREAAQDPARAPMSSWAKTQPLQAAAKTPSPMAAPVQDDMPTGPMTPVAGMTEPLPLASSPSLPSAVPVVMPAQVHKALDREPQNQGNSQNPPRLVSRTATVFWILLGCTLGIAGTAFWMSKRDVSAPSRPSHSSEAAEIPSAAPVMSSAEPLLPAEAPSAAAVESSGAAASATASAALPKAPKPASKEPARRRPIFGSDDAEEGSKAAAPPPKPTEKPKRPAAFGPILN